MVRTRFAPSPTGYLHIGSIQKIIYSYACAKKYGGEYILRFEDTDRSRFVAGAEEEIVKVHEILGVKIDESAVHGGPYAPYRQSERLDIYQKYALELIEKGFAYYAFETPEELEKLRQDAHANTRLNGGYFQFKSKTEYRDYPLEQAKQRVAAGEKYVVRIKTPENELVSYQDIIMGQIEFNTKDIDDYVLLKSDGFPTYHLAVVVDDYLMKISHVFRGVEWIPTSPVHVLLYKYFGWELPQFAHIPNILNPNGKGKLSKRHGDVSAMSYFQKGYLPEAVVNYMLLMAWSPKTEQELITLEEFCQIFKFENFNKGNPVFNPDKLNWFNQQYIRKLSPEILLARFSDWLVEFQSEQKDLLAKLTPQQLQQALVLEQERIVVWSDLLEKLQVFIEAPSEYEFEHKQIRDIPVETKQEIIESYREFVAGSGDIKHEDWEAFVRGLADKFNLAAGKVFMTMRIAITGKSATPPLFELTEIIGKEAQLQRLDLAKNKFAH